MRKLSLLAFSALLFTTACKKDLADDSSTYNDVTLFTEMTVPAEFEYKSSQLATVDVTIDGTEQLTSNGQFVITVFDNPNEASRKVLYKGLSNTESELSTQLRIPTAYKSIYVEANYRGTVIASGQYNTGGPIIPVELAIGSGKNSSIQSACTVTKSHGIGYTTTVNSVEYNGSTYEIEVLVEHDGCPGPTCKELSHYSIEADPGTYSNVNAALVTGTFSYGSIDLGPNLGGTPFDGFKVDGVSGIGDGMAGVFKVTYELTSLQSQRFRVKAGGNKLDVTFSVLDFQTVLNCDPDSDNDGVSDSQDDYPNDATRAFDNYYPNNVNRGTHMFEDLWPAQGDFDFNDLVLRYRYNMVTNASNEAVELVADYQVVALGAGYNNSFGVALPVLPNQVASVTGSELTGSFLNMAANGVEQGHSSEAVIIPFENLTNYAGGSHFVNVGSQGTSISFDTIQVVVSFTAPIAGISIGDAPFNPFIIVDQNRSREVHMINYEPTALSGTSDFGTVDDASIPGSGVYYTTANNYPWAIDIPDATLHLVEKSDIVTGHLDFAAWAQSGGLVNQGWYLSGANRNNANLIVNP